jgi:hypothetical protein
MKDWTSNREPKVLNIRDFVVGGKVQLPPNSVYIGRKRWYLGLKDSKWRNIPLPKNVTDAQRREFIEKFRAHLYESGLINDIEELREKDLVCWCAPKPCHGDLLVRLANQL